MDAGFTQVKQTDIIVWTLVARLAEPWARAIAQFTDCPSPLYFYRCAVSRCFYLNGTQPNMNYPAARFDPSIVVKLRRAFDETSTGRLLSQTPHRST